VGFVEKLQGYTVVYRRAEDVILAEVPAIPGCFSDGTSLEEARERVQDAILNFLEDLEDGAS
jgi:predicted RNase H-like HicB family nuclease